ncbi:c2H2-type domain-containing protein [Trichonephila clavata]|uniref:C2H2-type domain-containing protein n=1 Tax=Trichonephila clavata TaxID=2740835 RepID=A0A8X6FHG9_TRICU|nr:c2H2-type domain-containing protein [Trichonephila clavata]
MADKHLIEQQSFSGLSEKLKRLCALCDEKFRTMRELKEHYIEYHDDFELKHEKHVFNTDEGFEKLKKEEEIRTRSGIANIKSERKQHEKIGGSVKCGKTCPAFMTSIREQQQEVINITVEYQSVHAGHELEVGKLYLHQDDRRDLAALLKAGVPSTKIIEGIQKKHLPTERLGLLTKKVLHNLSQSFKVDETVLRTEDAVSVDLQEPVELVYERIRRRMQFINTAASMGNTEEIKRLDQSPEGLVKCMDYSEIGLSLRNIENFPANKNIVKQRQKKIQKTEANQC